MSDPTVSKCATCEKPAGKRCSRCVEGRDTNLVVSPTYYCSVACQTADFPSHKGICRKKNLRTQLLRGSELVQRVFYARRLVAFDIDICRIEKETDNMVLHDPGNGRPKGPLYALPDATGLSSEDQLAILSYGVCEDALAFMHELIKKTIGGILHPDRAPVEVDFHFQDATRKIQLRGSNRMMEQYKDGGHQILVVTLTNEEKYAIDICGAQFGQSKPVMPLRQYHNKHIRAAPSKVYRFGNAVLLNNDLVSNSVSLHGLGIDSRGPVVQTHITAIINREIVEWESKNKSIVALLKEKEVEYIPGAAAFVDMILLALSPNPSERLSWNAHLLSTPADQFRENHNENKDDDTHAEAAGSSNVSLYDEDGIEYADSRIDEPKNFADVLEGLTELREITLERKDADSGNQEDVNGMTQTRQE